MIVRNFIGYIEGEDINRVPQGYMVYPSKNVLLHKGKAYTRPGLENDGTAAVDVAGGVHSEFAWKDAKSGNQYLKAAGTNLYIKQKNRWFSILSSFQAAVSRVRFATWVDTNGSIIKKRLLMVDGSDDIYEWNGAVATIASISGQNITISGTSTLLQLGFDPGNSTPQSVMIVRFDGNGDVAGTETLTYDDASTTGIMHLTGTPTTPAAGDLVVAVPVTHTDKLIGVDKDEIYVYKNHPFIASLDSARIYYGHSVTKLEFTIPGTKTAATADLLDLDGNFRAMISRDNVLWISTEDDWFKITLRDSATSLGYWTDVEKFETAEGTGALPYAVANHKGEVVFMGSDKRLQRIITLEVLQRDDLQLMSDDVDALLQRLDLTDVRLYFHQRYIFIICPQESTMLMLDMIGFPRQEIGPFWQPPQTMPVSCMTVIDGVRYVHSNVRNETMTLFEGREDVGTPIEPVFAFGYYSGKDEYQLSQFNKLGISGRMTPTTTATVNWYYETDGERATNQTVIDGSEIKFFSVPDDVSYGSNPFATRSIGGADLVADDLKRFICYDTNLAIAFFEYTARITVSGDNPEFHLLGWMLDDSPANRKISDELFIQQ